MIEPEEKQLLHVSADRRLSIRKCFLDKLVSHILKVVAFYHTLRVFALFHEHVVHCRHMFSLNCLDCSLRAVVAAISHVPDFWLGMSIVGDEVDIIVGMKSSTYKVDFSSKPH